MQNDIKLKVISFTQRGFTDFYCYDPENTNIVVMSIVSNRENCIKAITSTINLGDSGGVYATDDIDHPSLYQLMEHKLSGDKLKNRVRIERLERNKAQYFHAVVSHRSLYEDNGNYFMCEGEPQKVLFNKLMRRFNLPLLPEWSDTLYTMLMRSGDLVEMECWCSSASHFANSRVFKLKLNEAQFEEMISNALKIGKIKICEEEQNPLQFKNLDEYFMRYGDSVAKDLCKEISPLAEYDTRNTVLLKKKRLFPKQAVLVNGLAKMLETSSYCIATAEMGCGKTLMGTVINEKHAQSTLQKKYGNLSVAELNKRANYRTVVMCPSHLLPKWAREVQEEIPLAKVTILREFEDVVKLVNDMKNKPVGKNFYIISKDFAKLDYVRTVPRQIA